MAIHELRHVDAHHGLFGVEHELGQGLAKLGLADAGRAEKHERAVGTIRIGQSRARAANRIRHRFHRLFLAHDALAQHFFHAQQLLALAFEHARYRDPGPLRYDLGDFDLGHRVAQQLVGLLFGLERLGKPLLEIGNASVLQFGHAREILRAPRRVEIRAGPLQLLLDMRRALHRGLLRLPDLLEIRVLLFQPLECFFQRAQTLARCLIGFLLERLALDLELDDAPVELVERFGL